MTVAKRRVIRSTRSIPVVPISPIHAKIIRDNSKAQGMYQVSDIPQGMQIELPKTRQNDMLVVSRLA